MRVRFQDPLTKQYKVLATMGFSIVDHPGVIGDLDSLSVALSETLLGAPEWYGKDWHEEVLRTASVNESYPDYLREFSGYVYALSADFGAGFVSGDYAEADRRYGEFLGRFPNSVYKTAVEQGASGIATLGGAESYVSQWDGVRCMPRGLGEDMK